MTYLSGYTIKPYIVEADGEVIFTDGTNNDIRANQLQCEAYGYTYDRNAGVCRAFQYNTRLTRDIHNLGNKINGPGNTTATGVNTVQINGTNNTAEGFNNNCFISGRDNTIANEVNNATIIGSNNEIESGVNNATVVGSFGKALRDGDFVVGGGSIGDTSTFSLNGITRDATATDLAVNNSLVKIIARTPDTIQSYTFDIIGYRTGGASGSGSAGDRIFLRVEGIVSNITADEVLSTIVSRGTVAGWSAKTSYSGTNDMTLEVQGVAAMDITWKATATFQNLIA